MTWTVLVIGIAFNMKIPTIRGSNSVAGRNWETSEPVWSGKCRKVSDEYRNNFDNIAGFGKKTGKMHTRVKFVDGKRVEESR